jgi:hypothetical protein
MKPASLALGLSCVVNAGLLALLLFPGRESADEHTMRIPPTDRGASTGLPVRTGSSAFATKDPAALAARLRAAGSPEKFVLRVIVAEHERAFAERHRSDYWRLENPGDPAEIVARRQREREERMAFERLIGDEAASELMAEWMEMQFGRLPAEKRARVYALQRDYEELRQPLQDPFSSGMPSAETREKLLLLEKEMRADLAKILTAEEFQEHELRWSPTAQSLRTQLVGFNATEAEYRALFALRRPIDEQFHPLSMSTPEAGEQRRAAEQALGWRIAALLGPERYADYQQAMRPEHRQLNQLVARLELPLSAAAQVAAVQTDVQRRVSLTRNDRALAPAEREARLRALAEEAQAKITAALGRRGYEGYQLHGGNWLQNIAPRPAAKK